MSQFVLLTIVNNEIKYVIKKMVKKSPQEVLKNLTELINKKKP